MNNRKTLVSVHCYAGDQQQVVELMPVFEHHRCPIVIMSPEDSKIERMGRHSCRFAGKRAYVGQDSWDRQHLQLKILLEYDFDWYLLNDSDSLILSPQIPEYLFDDPEILYSNEVTDFRVPGQVFEGIRWADDYHAGYPLIAMQPPYFMSRQVLERLVAASAGLQACPVTPFIDWWFVPACEHGKIKHLPFRHGASCETVTQNGLLVMLDCVTKRKATCIHAIKSGEILRTLQKAYRATL